MENDSSQQKEKPGFFERMLKSRREGASEDEILELVEDADELDDDEKRMIGEIVALGDTTAGSICTPRMDVMFVRDDESGRAALERMRGTGYSRLPVCHDDIDEVIGIVNIKDLIGPLMDGSIDDTVDKFMYEAMFIPETKDALPLLGEMQAAQRQMAIVVDEYGGTEGVITIEDIVEEIVGEISDESDIQGEILAVVGPGTWRADGRLAVADARELGWPVEESDDYETIAGWLLGELDSVPVPGDSVTRDDFKFTIERMRRNRISKIKVEKTEPQSPGEGVSE